MSLIPNLSFPTSVIKSFRFSHNIKYVTLLPKHSGNFLSPLKLVQTVQHGKYSDVSLLLQVSFKSMVMLALLYCFSELHRFVISGCCTDFRLSSMPNLCCFYDFKIGHISQIFPDQFTGTVFLSYKALQCPCVRVTSKVTSTDTQFFFFFLFMSCGISG